MRLILALGAIIALAFLYGYLEQHPDAAFAALVVTALCSILLVALLRGERTRNRREREESLRAAWVVSWTTADGRDYGLVRGARVRVIAL